ncbi:12339_t:CDS:10 [Ambispora gerdemannii]|uniref:12339_t:CDS:1 n=1 Tax=Ambispora gerdemannii TaxID=144530 RepID=A0A9N9G452_9GLOM|nr:12339_t:CDS:10 [Ambispora gerdemannii]
MQNMVSYETEKDVSRSYNGKPIPSYPEAMCNNNYTHEYGYETYRTSSSPTSRPRARSSLLQHPLSPSQCPEQMESPRHSQFNNTQHSHLSQSQYQQYQTLAQHAHPPQNVNYTEHATDYTEFQEQTLPQYNGFSHSSQQISTSSQLRQSSYAYQRYYELAPVIAVQPAERFSSAGQRTLSLTSNSTLSTTSNLIIPKNSEKNPIHIRRSTDSVREKSKHNYVKKSSERQRSFSYSDASPLISDISNPPSPSTNLAKQRAPIVYAALLSRVAEAFQKNITLSTKKKDDLEYKGSFDGREAVDIIAYIIKTTDRNLALLLGRALDAQKFFHDVTYDHRLLDSYNELYQFQKMPSFLASSDDYETTAEQQEKEDFVEDNDLPNGVFTLLTDCYSPTCTRDSVCYSITCPRRLEQQARITKAKPDLERSPSRGSLSNRKDHKLWVHSVSPDIANSVSETEKKRQEAINEVIYTEKDFVRDLEYLRDIWIDPLLYHNAIPEERREEFVNQVFYNIEDIHKVNSKLADALQKRQNSYAIVDQIGDIFLEFVPKFDEPFIEYGAHQLLGKYEFEREKNDNQAFAKFVEDTERRPESRKLELNGYLTKPTTRLGRYPLLLEAVLKQTPSEHPDQTNLTKVIRIIREILTSVNIESGKSENRFNLQQLDNQLKTSEYHAGLKLTEPGRQLIYKGTMKKRSGGESSDLQVFLFDHVLLMVKAKKTEQYKIYRKPIPLELLTTSITENLIENIQKIPKRPPSILPPAVVNNIRDKQYALNFTCIGKKGFSVTLYASTVISRNKWIEHIEKQQQFLLDRGQVFEKATLLEGKYFVGTNKVNCVAFFDDYQKLALGTEEGVYVADIGQNPKQPIQVLHLEKVSQIAVLEEFRLLLILADKIFYWLPVEALDPGDANNSNKKPRKITSNASFFKCGVCLDKTLVAVVRTYGLAQSIIRTFEPIEQSIKSKIKGPILKNLLRGAEALKLHKNFYIPRESTSIHFLKKTLCVGCTKGFEIINMETLATQALLDPADATLDFVQKRENIKPIALFRTPNSRGDRLLCYDEFAFYVNKVGWRARHDWHVTWEGAPTFFAFRDPYLLAFEPSFIEIRNVETGLLEQIIKGHNLRCLCSDDRGNILVVTNDPTSDCSEVFSLNLADGRRSSLLSEATSIATTIVAPEESGNNGRSDSVE